MFYFLFPNLYKLENLFNVESHVIDPRLTVSIIHKIGNICILTIDSNEVYNGKNYGDVLFNIPEKFRPKSRTPVPVGIINSVSGGAAHIEPDGNVIWRGSKTISALYINAVYLANVLNRTNCNPVKSDTISC